MGRCLYLVTKTMSSPICTSVAVGGVGLVDGAERPVEEVVAPSEYRAALQARRASIEVGAGRPARTNAAQPPCTRFGSMDQCEMDDE